MRIGIDLGGTKIEGIAIEEDGGERDRRRVPTPRDDYDATIEAIAGLVDELERAVGRTCTVGIGTPGAISPATGRLKNANSVWLNGRPLDHDLARRLDREVRLANDANCFALSEATDGAAATARVVFGVILGTGVGGGIVVDRRVLTGPHAIAGEWGHNPLPWPVDGERPGPSCYCGRDGCIETFCSGPALERAYRRQSGTDLPAAVIAERAGADRVADRTLEAYEDRLARALATVINVLDPDAIVLGGGMSNLMRLYANVPRRWSRYVFSDEVHTPLLRARHGDSSGVRGAAWLWPRPGAPGQDR